MWLYNNMSEGEWLFTHNKLFNNRELLQLPLTQYLEVFIDAYQQNAYEQAKDKMWLFYSTNYEHLYKKFSNFDKFFKKSGVKPDWLRGATKRNKGISADRKAKLDQLHNKFKSV